jgi:hypothetical protein
MQEQKLNLLVLQVATGRNTSSYVGGTSTRVFVYAVASAFKVHRVNITFGNIKTHLLFMWDTWIFLVKHRFIRSSWELLLTSAGEYNSPGCPAKYKSPWHCSREQCQVNIYLL